MPEGPMRFCMVTTFYPPYHFGGDAMFVYWLSNELARRGHHVTVAHCVDAYHLLHPAEPGADYPNHSNVTVVRLRSRWRGLSPLVTYLTGQPGLKAGALRALFEAEPFDVTHFHNVSLVGGPGVLHLGQGVKLYTMHEHWLVCPMHVLWKNDRELCQQPSCLSCTLTYRKPPQLWRYTGALARGLREVDLFLAPSRFTAQEHRARGFSHEIRYLPHFLPAMDEPVAAEAAPRPERPYFLFAGRLEYIKGVQTLIEQFRTYTAADLLVAGDGQHAPALRAQAADLPHVRFLGRVHPTRLRRLYAGATAVLAPSLCYETFGLVSIEAFAARTPAIVRDLGALPEPVRESGAGFVYRTDTELRNALDALVQDPALRRELGERGHAAYLARWSAEPHMRAYLDLVEEARARHTTPVSPRREEVLV